MGTMRVNLVENIMSEVTQEWGEMDSGVALQCPPFIVLSGARALQMQRRVFNEFTSRPQSSRRRMD